MSKKERETRQMTYEMNARWDARLTEFDVELIGQNTWRRLLKHCRAKIWEDECSSSIGSEAKQSSSLPPNTLSSNALDHCLVFFHNDEIIVIFENTLHNHKKTIIRIYKCTTAQNSTFDKNQEFKQTNLPQIRVLQTLQVAFCRGFYTLNTS